MPRGGKELLEGTAAGEYLETKREAQKTGKKKEETVMETFERLKELYFRGDMTSARFSREAKLRTKEILRSWELETDDDIVYGDLPEAPLPLKLREDYADLQKRLDANVITSEEFSRALEGLIDSYLPGKPGKKQRVQ